MRRIRGNKRASMETNQNAGYQRVGFSLYPTEVTAVKKVQQKAAEMGIYLDASKAARLLIRTADIGKISRKDIELVVAEVSKKRLRNQ